MDNEIKDRGNVDIWDLLVSKALGSDGSIFEQVNRVYDGAVSTNIGWYCYKYSQTPMQLRGIISGIIKDHIWTLNAPYIHDVINAVIQCASLGEEKFQQAFGGWNPEAGRFGIVKINPEDIPFGEKGESYDLPPSRLVMVTGFITKGGKGIHSATIDAGSEKLPRATFYRPDHGDICLLNKPIIIENNSYLRTVLKDEDGNMIGGNDRLTGYWFVKNPDILLRRDVK